MTLAEKILYFNQLLENQEYNFIIYLHQINVNKNLELLNNSQQVLNYLLQLKTQYYLNSLISYDQFMVNFKNETYEFHKFCFNSKIFIEQKLNKSYPIDLLIKELKYGYSKCLYKWW